jgi:hypothetical protein
MPAIDIAEFVRAQPKVELHLHLVGSASAETVLALARLLGALGSGQGTPQGMVSVALPGAMAAGPWQPVGAVGIDPGRELGVEFQLSRRAEL